MLFCFLKIKFFIIFTNLFSDPNINNKLALNNKNSSWI